MTNTAWPSLLSEPYVLSSHRRWFSAVAADERESAVCGGAAGADGWSGWSTCHSRLPVWKSTAASRCGVRITMRSSTARGITEGRTSRDARKNSAR